MNCKHGESIRVVIKCVLTAEQCESRDRFYHNKVIRVLKVRLESNGYCAWVGECGKISGMKQRETNIEVYRVALMFGICLLHTIGFGGYSMPWMQNVLLSCVVGLVFISGWFGVKFSWWKLVRLYGIGFYCAMVFGTLSAIGGGDRR